MLAFTPMKGGNELEKKFNIARGESQKKIYRREKQNTPTLQGVKTHLPLKKFKLLQERFI
jgi:hypothetical protein